MVVGTGEGCGAESRVAVVVGTGLGELFRLLFFARFSDVPAGVFVFATLSFLLFFAYLCLVNDSYSMAAVVIVGISAKVFDLLKMPFQQSWIE